MLVECTYSKTCVVTKLTVPTLVVFKMFFVILKFWEFYSFEISTTARSSMWGWVKAWWGGGRARLWSSANESCMRGTASEPPLRPSPVGSHMEPENREQPCHRPKAFDKVKSFHFIVKVKSFSHFSRKNCHISDGSARETNAEFGAHWCAC